VGTGVGACVGTRVGKVVGILVGAKVKIDVGVLVLTDVGILETGVLVGPLVRVVCFGFVDGLAVGLIVGVESSVAIIGALVLTTLLLIGALLGILVAILFGITSSVTGAIVLTRLFIDLGFGFGFGVGAVVDNKLSSVLVTGATLLAGCLFGEESSVLATGILLTGLALGLDFCLAIGANVESSFDLVLSSLLGELVLLLSSVLETDPVFGLLLTVVGLYFGFALGSVLGPLKLFGLFFTFPHPSAVPPIFLFNQSRPLLTVLSTT